MRKNDKRILKKLQREVKRRQKPERADENPQIGSAKPQYELSDRARATDCGGIALVNALVDELKLRKTIDEMVHMLKQHQPYHESDHVLNIAYNILAGGTRLEHIKYRREDIAYLNAIGAHSIPDQTTAADFLQRFRDKEQIDNLQEAFNTARMRAWATQGPEFFEEAVIDADGTICPTGGQNKEGIGLSYNGQWGYHMLVISLASTGEPLYMLNRPGNRPSHEDAAEYLDKADELCRRAGFKHVHFRGDTAFSQTAFLDGWDSRNITFVFGLRESPTTMEIAESLPESQWQHMQRGERMVPPEKQRDKRPRIREVIVREKGYKNMVLEREDVAEVQYRPTNCSKPYRLILLRKSIDVYKGCAKLFPEVRYFYYLTNDATKTPIEVVRDSNKRCNQENILSQLKNGVHAMTMPSHDLYSNWAYAVMVALAWSLKVWMGLLLPISPRWQEKHKSERDALIKMEFPTFLRSIMLIPAQVLATGRRVVTRLLAWSEWIPAIFRLAETLNRPLRM